MIRDGSDHLIFPKLAMPELKIDGNEVSFWVRVKPRSSRERLRQGNDGDLKLDIYAPAIDGQANEACIRFLAHALRLPRSGVRIVSGERARRKLIRVAGSSPANVVRSIEGLLAAPKL